MGKNLNNILRLCSPNQVMYGKTMATECMESICGKHSQAVKRKAPGDVRTVWTVVVVVETTRC